MDAQDGAASPEQRPASSLSGRSPSVASSSISEKHATADSRTQMSGSEIGSMGQSHSSDAVHHVRDIAPHEASLCHELTEDLRAYLTPNNHYPIRQQHHGLPASLSHSIEASIRQTATAIRCQAKWFAPEPLADLLDTALRAAAPSSSSAALYAALRLVDTIGTYIFIPPGCLPLIAGFLAQTYYRTSRANKTKKVATYARAVAVNILRSHLGTQLDEALLGTLGGDLTTQDGFAVTAGVLMLLLKRLRSKKADLPQVEINEMLERLRYFAATTTDTFVMEYVLDAVAMLVANTSYREQIQQDAGWTSVLDILLHCWNVLGAAATDALQEMAVQLSTLEPRLLLRAAWLYVQAGILLTEPLSLELRTRYCTLVEGDDWHESYEDIVALCSRAPYLKELTAYTERNILMHHLAAGVSQSAVSAMAKDYTRHILDSGAVPEAKIMLTRAMIRMFLCSAMTEHAEQELHSLYEALCTVSGMSVEAASFLFRIRADVAGSIYVLPSSSDNTQLSTGVAQVSTLPNVEKWLVAINGVLRDGAQTWEVYEYFLLQTKVLLSNHTFFAGKIRFVKDIQATLTQKIESGDFIEPPPHTGLNKSNVAAQVVQVLTASLSYHRQLTKDDITSLVALFDATAGSRDYIVSIQCIHALTVCCYEVPDVMTRYMDDVIDRMSRMVTQRYLAIHVIQFLIGLSRLRDLYRNFTLADYKKIFAVCNSYLQSTRSEQTVVERRRTPTSEASSATPRDEEALPEYVYAIAHHAITFWYQNLKRQDREALKPYITSCLTYQVNGKDHIEEQGLVTIDAMDRVDARDGSDELPEEHPFTNLDGRLIERHRLVGMLLVSTKTSLRTGRTLVTVRRPSGTMQRLLRQGRTRVTVDDEDSYLTVMPDDILGHTYGAITIPRPSSALGSVEIITLPEEDSVRRAIQSFDRTSALDSHKAGVIYIGEGQTTEERILQNISGSPDYKEFVRDLGDLERLKSASFNTQGLDRADDTDGTCTIVWHNRVTEMVYHVTTMMPNSEDPTENTGRKKRHIGNDHVNIVFNNSGISYDFTSLYNLFPGQLTYVYIVIMPSARTSFMQTRTTNLTTPKADRFYSVEVVTRPDYPNISSAADAKVVSGASLGGMVRNLALNECIMSLMWTQRDQSAEYPSSWRSRMHQLRRLADRYRAKGA